MNLIFIDTSALMALLVQDDLNHEDAAQFFHALSLQSNQLVTTNYVVGETISILQRRYGMSAVITLVSSIMPILQVAWVEQNMHTEALQAFQVANRRSLSLVDCTSFTLMRHWGISAAFVFDEHFEQQGFTCLP